MVPMLSNETRSVLATNDQRYLLELCRGSIRHGLSQGCPLPVDVRTLPSQFASPCATFVTLHKDGQLRGCIGCLQALRPLAADVVENAFAAAFRDPRFPPVCEDEVEMLEIHLSILTVPEPLVFTSEHELLAQLKPGVDGLILEHGAHRGTFLPAVWESLEDPRDFLRHLKLKAGLPGDYWSPDIRISRYRADVIDDVRS